jgi:hypothetical protein
MTARVVPGHQDAPGDPWVSIVPNLVYDGTANALDRLGGSRVTVGTSRGAKPDAGERLETRGAGSLRIDSRPRKIAPTLRTNGGTGHGHCGPLAGRRFGSRRRH